MQRRARNPYINYHMMRFWPSLEMVLLTGFHSNLNLFASFGEDSAENWTRFENWWTIVNCYAECSPQQRQQLLHLPPLPEQNICMDQISRKQLVIFFLGIRGFHTTAAFQAVGLLFLRMFIPSKGQLTIRVLQSKKNKMCPKNDSYGATGNF